MISLAEQLLPEVRPRCGLDRADAAVAQLESISLRDLRTTVVGATPRDEQGRALLATLREALTGRVAKIRTTWEEEIGHARRGWARCCRRCGSRLGHRMRELDFRRRSRNRSRRPRARRLTRRCLPSDGSRSKAAAASPVRLSVKPAGMPTDESGTLRQSAAAWAGRIPALTPMLGLALPPPPRPVRRVAPERGRRQGQRQPGPEATTAATIDAAAAKSARGPVATKRRRRPRHLPIRLTL